MRNYSVRILILLLFTTIQVQLLSQEIKNSITIDVDGGTEIINKNIYGQFAEHLGRCIYDGIWVGEDSKIPNINGYRKEVIEALKELEVPVIRWPGGCFADTYHWKDGIGPKDQRPDLENKFWGGSIEDNSFGTHEFLNLCELIGAEPYLAVNVGSGSPREMMEWIEYVNSDKDTPMANLRRKNGREKPWNVKYWGIGNESWGCGGNMDPEYYSDSYNRFATYAWVDHKIASGGLPDDFEWTETLMKKTVGSGKNIIDGISFHNYTVTHTWDKKGSATDFDESDWFLTLSKTLNMEEILKKHIDILDKYDKENKVAIMADEWGNWHDSEPGSNPGHLYQQNTLRDAITAALYLNIFNKYCGRVKMANIAQTVNVLQAMLLTNDNEVVKTPTFYVFKMYKKHFDATLLPLEIQCQKYSSGDDSIPALSVSASKNKEGEINITIANVDPNNNIDTEIAFAGMKNFTVSNSEIITGEKINSYNDFNKSEEVNIEPFNKTAIKNGILKVEIPSKSILLISLKQ